MKVVLELIFYKNSLGKEPVREWLRDLPSEDRRKIGKHLLFVQRNWPVGKPHVDSFGKGLWEVSIKLDNRIARIPFIIIDGSMIALHSFIKKTQQTSPADIALARKRAAEIYSKLGT